MGRAFLARRYAIALTVGLVAVLAAPMLVATAGTPQGDLEIDSPPDIAECEQALEGTGFTLLFSGKADSNPAEGIYTIPGDGTITITNTVPPSGTVNFSSTTFVVGAVFVKKGTGDTITVIDPPSLTGSFQGGPLTGDGEGPSHITFCFVEEVPPPVTTTTAPPTAAQAAPPPPPPLVVTPRFTG